MFESSVAQPQVKKRLFIGLLLTSLLTIVGLTLLLWYLFFQPATIIQKAVLIIFIGAIILTVLVIAFGIGGIVFTIWRAKTINFLQPMMRISISLLFPVVVGLGRLFKIDIDKIRGSFIEVNNQLVKTKRLKVRPSQLLILAPHCLQKSSCPHKITNDINNCKRCGSCPVDELLKIRDRYKVNIRFATGGTLARKYVKEYKPKAIVAVACERDLASGIRDSTPIPVLGVLNERPFGPCFNTKVSIPKLEEAVKYFIEGELSWKLMLASRH